MIFVSPTGLDTQDGLSEGTALKTLAKAASKLPDGGEIRVLPGNHLSQAWYNYSPTAQATVRLMPGATMAHIDMRGVHDVTIESDKQSGRLASIDMQRGYGGWVQRITVQNLDMTTLRAYNNTTDLIVRKNHFHDAGTAINGPGRVDATYTSRRIEISDNLIERCSGDAISCSDWTQVTIARNRIVDAVDPRSQTDPVTCWSRGTPNPYNLPECFHSDGIQVAGGVEDLLIEDNQILRASTQGIIIQAYTPAVKRATKRVTIRRNLIQKTTNAMMLNGPEEVLVEQNVAHGRLNGIEFSQGFTPTTTPVVAIIRDNVLSKLVVLSPATATASNNLIRPS